MPLALAPLSNDITAHEIYLRLGKSAVVALVSAYIMPIATLKPGEVAGMKANDLSRSVCDECFTRANSLALTVSQTRRFEPGVFNHGYSRL
jgi:hypothetical protein